MCSASDSMNINSKSIIKTLKEDHILNDSLLVSLNSISLEDLIAVKLELSAVHLNNRLYGFDIWRALPAISKEAALKFEVTATHSKKDAARFLGLTYSEFLNIYKKYEVDNFFNKEQNA